MTMKTLFFDNYGVHKAKKIVMFSFRGNFKRQSILGLTLERKIFLTFKIVSFDLKVIGYNES